ncbi:hypothetical protein MMC30_005410 [Trapelia coarctata]|nr:hypothetical protein [Trapelia coarctata]
MAPSTLSQFNCALVTGGGGGLGRAMAEYLVKTDKKVIIAGRTESNLQKMAQELGHGTAYYVLDTGNISAISSFVKKFTTEHPEVDCVINNAGVQRPLDINDFALDKADQEIDINIRGPMRLIIGPLPHFKKRKSTVIMNVSSVLDFIPTSVINPVYNGTKAMNLRTQLKGTGVHVVEIVLPTVATDLHRERQDPDDNKKEKNKAALSVDEFMGDLVQGWEEGREVIGAAMAKGVVERWYTSLGMIMRRSIKSEALLRSLGVRLGSAYML